MTNDETTTATEETPTTTSKKNGKKKGDGDAVTFVPEGYSDALGVKFSFDPEALHILGLDSDIEDDDPLFDAGIKTPLEKEHVDNVKRDGIHAEILVTPRLVDGKMVPAVVDGRTRTRWARRANQLRGDDNQMKVDARNATADEIEKIRVMKHALNFVRANRSPAARAHAAEELRKAGRSNKEIATDLGISVSTVENLLAFSNAAPEVKKAFESGKLTVAGAYKLAKMKVEKQPEALKETLALAAPAAKTGKPVKAKVSDAQRGRRKAKGEEPAHQRPSIGKIAKILAAAKVDKNVLEGLTKSEPLDFLRWVVGEVSERVLHADVRQVIQGKYKLPSGDKKD